MKNSKILLIIVIILSIILIVDIASWFTKVETPITTEKVLPECVRITKVFCNTSDAIKLRVSCKWHIDVTTTDTDRLKVDLIVSRTIKKYFNDISYEYLLEHKFEILEDLQERIKDCVFALQPYGFNIITISVGKEDG